MSGIMRQAFAKMKTGAAISKMIQESEEKMAKEEFIKKWLQGSREDFATLDTEVQEKIIIRCVLEHELHIADLLKKQPTKVPGKKTFVTVEGKIAVLIAETAAFSLVEFEDKVEIDPKVPGAVSNLGKVLKEKVHPCSCRSYLPGHITCSPRKAKLV